MGLCRWTKRKIHTALGFSKADWWVVWQAWVLLLAFDLSLRLLPFKQVQRLAAWRRKEPAPQSNTPPDAIARLQHLVNIAARNHLYTMGCLRQSLVLQWLLARRGIGVELRIGVAREAGDLAAHAWLEYAGQPIGEPQTAARFARLESVR